MVTLATRSSVPVTDAPAEYAAARPAATAVVLRPRGDDHECFMLVRSSKSPFMPEALVFPGGRVDAADGPLEDDASWVRAALRECIEEAGLELDANAMQWFDTWCTPSGEGRRFLARFFRVVLGDADGHDAQADGHETQDGRWCTAAEALAAWRAGTADLPPPTLCILLRLDERGIDGLLADDVDALREPILPKVASDGEIVQVVMPHDPGYDAIAGDAAPAPARTEGMPTRFARRDNRWVPC